MIEKFGEKTKGDRYLPTLSIPAFPPQYFSYLKIDVGSLGFLANKGKLSVITDLLLVEESFEEIVTLINGRSELHVSKIQKKMEEIDFIQGEGLPKGVSHEKMIQHMGIPLLQTAYSFSESIDNCLMTSISDHERTTKKLYEVGKELFPEDTIISLKKVDEVATHDIG